MQREIDLLKKELEKYKLLVRGLPIPVRYTPYKDKIAKINTAKDKCLIEAYKFCTRTGNPFYWWDLYKESPVLSDLHPDTVRRSFQLLVKDKELVRWDEGTYIIPFKKLIE